MKSSWTTDLSSRRQSFSSFLEEQGIKLQMASTFNPQENRLMEHWNRMLKYGVQAFCSLDRPWNDGIQALLLQHQHMPATAQGPSPATLFFRHATCLAFEIVHTPDTCAEASHACEQLLNTDSTHAAPCSTMSVFNSVAESGKQPSTNSALSSQQSASRGNTEPAPVQHDWSRLHLLF